MSRKRVLFVGVVMAVLFSSLSLGALTSSTLAQEGTPVAVAPPQDLMPADGIQAHRLFQVTALDGLGHAAIQGRTRLLAG